MTALMTTSKNGNLQNDICQDSLSNLTAEQIELIKTTICNGATDNELRLFLYTAKKSGLDPLMRQIHAVKRKSKDKNGQWRDVMSIQTGIDGYRLIAARTGLHAGTDEAVIVEKNGLPVSASVTVYKMIGGQRVPFTATARFDEYCQRQSTGEPTKFWKTMPFHQLAKCAESLALRKAFPQELSGLYTNEEMDQADNDIDVKSLKAFKSEPKKVLEKTVEAVAQNAAPAMSESSFASVLDEITLYNNVDDLKKYYEKTEAMVMSQPQRSQARAAIRKHKLDLEKMIEENKEFIKELDDETVSNIQ